MCVLCIRIFLGGRPPHYDGIKKSNNTQQQVKNKVLTVRTVLRVVKIMNIFYIVLIILTPARILTTS